MKHNIILEEKIYTQSDILKDLENTDIPDPYKRFPLFGDDYIHLSSSRITLFSDDKNWAIVFEQVGYDRGLLLNLTMIGETGKVINSFMVNEATISFENKLPYFKNVYEIKFIVC